MRVFFKNDFEIIVGDASSLRSFELVCDVMNSNLYNDHFPNGRTDDLLEENFIWCDIHYRIGGQRVVACLKDDDASFNSVVATTLTDAFGLRPGQIREVLKDRIRIVKH